MVWISCRLTHPPPPPHTHTVVFGDDEMAAKILASTIPKEQKSFGRSVSNFNADRWTSECRDVVKEGNRAKVASLSGVCMTMIIPMVVM